MTAMHRADVAVVGAGIVGLAIARAIVMRHPDTSVLVLDKSPALGAHASGRNSGVLHAGFYYAPDSLKARLTRDGNRMMREFLADAGVPVVPTGKVVVTTDAAQLPALHELARRAHQNQVAAELVDVATLATLEPRARTVELALWSPTTSVASPAEVIGALCADAQQRGVQVHLGERVTSAAPGWVQTTAARYQVGHVVNAAGLQADQVAEWFGARGNYLMLPFKGLYWYANVPPGFLRRQVYPVPDPRNPFLGVHATITASGAVKIGPTAIPALWRENYARLHGFSASELAQVTQGMAALARSPHHDFTALLRSELPKYLRRNVVRAAAALVPDLADCQFHLRGQTGIRAQLFDTSARRLEMDFVVRADASSTHLLNSVSPAWTSSLAVAEHTVDLMVAAGAL